MTHPSRLCRPFLVTLACLPAAVSAAPDTAAPAEEIIAAANKPGGLLVNLACTDGRLTAELGRSGTFIVLGIARDATAAAAAREYIASAGLHGRTVVLERGAGRLPVMDNSAAVVVCGASTGALNEEIMRILAPLGALVVRDNDDWKKQVAPWPEDIDEWTHFLHGPDNNAVARDRVVGPPSRLQWLADPIHLRSHEHLNSKKKKGSGTFFGHNNSMPAIPLLPEPRFSPCTPPQGGLTLPAGYCSTLSSQRRGAHVHPPCEHRQLATVLCSISLTGKRYE